LSIHYKIEDNIQGLGFYDDNEILDVRIDHPVYETDHEAFYDEVLKYCSRVVNLFLGVIYPL
jgi:hypothetical protein